MALEELLRQQDRPTADGAPSAGAVARDRGSLIQQAGAMMGVTEEGFARPEAPEEQGERPCCADGYVRRSPVQPYRVAEDYHKRRIRKAVTVLVLIGVAALLVVALMRAKLLRF